MGEVRGKQISWETRGWGASHRCGGLCYPPGCRRRALKTPARLQQQESNVLLGRDRAERLWLQGVTGNPSVVAQRVRGRPRKLWSAVLREGKI